VNNSAELGGPLVDGEQPDSGRSGVGKARRRPLPHHAAMKMKTTANSRTGP
jgi:hypothetical protein